MQLRPVLLHAPRPELVVLTVTVLLGACSDSAGKDTGSASETAGDGDGDNTASAGDGDGTPGDGDGTPGDGDGDGAAGDGDGDGACEGGPTPAGTLMGTWADLPEPSVGFDCSLAEGDGPNWQDGIVVADGGAGIDFVEIGSDGKAYAAGWIGEGSLLAGVELDGQGPNSQGVRWARSWTYAGEAWPAAGLVATDNGRLWLNTAPEHLLAAGQDGALLDGPLELFVPGDRYIRAIGRGDGNLLVAAIQRATPPNCIEYTRMQIHDQTSADPLATSPTLISPAVFGLEGDGSGGGWMATLDLNGAALTANHYDNAADVSGMFGLSNQANNVMAADMAVAPNGELVFALRSLGFIEVHRYAPDGTQLWTMTLPDYGQQYGEPRVAVDGMGAAVIGVTVGTSFELARVLADGSLDWGGRYACAAAVELHDVDVADNGDVWVGGVQDQTAWLGAL
jgi:hypothetical protein